MKKGKEGRAVKDPVRGARIRAMRLALKLNQVELAARIEVDQSTVSDIEQGAGFSADLLIRLADTLGASPGIVMRGYDKSSWPFEHIGIEEVASLNPEERSFVEGRLAEYLAQVTPPKPLQAIPLTPRRTTKASPSQRKPRA